MAARPDFLKNMDANSFPYQLYSEDPFVPPVDYSTDDLWLKPRRRPPTPPTDYAWDNPFPFVSYGGQQNFGNLKAFEPPVDYHDSQLEPLEKRPLRNEEQQRVVVTPTEQKSLKSSIVQRTVPRESVEQFHESQNHVQLGERFRACADCPICKAITAAESALTGTVPDSKVRAPTPPPPPRPVVYQTLSPSAQQPFGGVPVFPRVSPVNANNYPRQMAAPPRDVVHRPRRISFEEDYARDASFRNRTISSEDDAEEQAFGGYSNVPYQKERRQLAYAEDMAARKAFMARAVVDRVARSAQELTIFKGEILEVLNDRKSWWKCCNVAGQIGYVPFTLLKMVDKHETKAIGRMRTPEPDYRSGYGYSRRTR